MNRSPKSFKSTVLTIAFFFVLPLTNAVAESPPCYDLTSLNSSEINITPKLDCLKIAVEEAGCSEGGVAIEFQNSCDADIVITGNDERDEFTEDVEVAEWSFYDSIILPIGEISKELTYTAKKGEETFEINVDFSATSKEREVSDAACSSVGGDQMGIFLLLGFGFLIARRMK